MIISINCERQRVEKIEKDMEKGAGGHNHGRVLSDQRDSRICLSGSGEDIGE